MTLGIIVHGGAKSISEDKVTADNLKSVWFRYFNAAGADPNGNLGEDHEV